MKRTVSLFLSLLLILSCVCITPAMAANDSDIRVRVNGEIVAFPDQGPVIDANSRTLVPVRFATEALGAKVTWNNNTYTATISKNGISVDVAIGRKDITVTRGGSKKTVTMDTEAVLINNRTMVPIRFVAEALGAYVDWSNQYRVVGIYQGSELSAEQIKTLMAEPVTRDGSIFTTLKPFRGEWADAREMVFNDYVHSRYYRALKKDIAPKTAGEQIKYIIDEAKATMEYHSANLDITFATDPCLVYSQLAEGAICVSVRGYVTVNEKIDIGKMSGTERYLVISLLNTKKNATVGEPYTFAIDAHMLIDAIGVELHEIEGLASAQAAGYTWELGHGVIK